MHLCTELMLLLSLHSFFQYCVALCLQALVIMIIILQWQQCLLQSIIINQSVESNLHSTVSYVPFWFNAGGPLIFITEVNLLSAMLIFDHQHCMASSTCLLSFALPLSVKGASTECPVFWVFFGPRSVAKMLHVSTQ